jgi:hypothetical protein
MHKCYQSIVIQAPIDIVWDLVKNFHDMKWAKSVIETCEPVGAKNGEEAGAKRILNGGCHQTLLDFNEQEHIIRYSIDEGSFPISACDVKSYVGQLRLIPVTISNLTFAEWSSTWESSFNTADDFCNLIYVLLLTSLANSAKTHLIVLDNMRFLH